MLARFVIWVFSTALGLLTQLAALAVMMMFWAGPGVRLTVQGLSMIRATVVGAVIAGVRTLKLSLAARLIACGVAITFGKLLVARLVIGVRIMVVRGSLTAW